MIGRTRPSAIIGQTLATTSATISLLPPGPLDRARPQRRGDHAGPLAEQLADVELGLHPALHADDDQPAVGGQRVDIAVEVGRAHDVEDHVGASPAGCVADPLDEVLVAVGDGDLGAQLGAQVELVRDPGGDRHPAAERAGHLDRVRADAAGAAVDEEQLAGASGARS